LKWLEVSIAVDGELAEAVADLFTRWAGTGIVIEATHSDEAQGAVASPHGLTVRAYRLLDEDTSARMQWLEEGLWHLSQIAPLPEPSYRQVEEEDWSETWKAHFRPIPVGRKLLIVPSWLKPPSGERLRLILDPGMAFGTGAHPSTRLCLLALEERLVPGDTVIDLGCGSGILAIAAARLGARHVVALDNDPQAVRVAEENVAANQVEQRVSVRLGSLEHLAQEETEPSREAEVVVANILAPVLQDMLEAGLAGLVRRGGHLILSGILASQVESLLATASSQGLHLVEKKGEEDWRALVLQR